MKFSEEILYSAPEMYKASLKYEHTDVYLNDIFEKLLICTLHKHKYERYLFSINKSMPCSM